MPALIDTDVLRVLPPEAPEYARARKDQIRSLWKTYRPGQSIESFRVDLRDRLLHEMSRPHPRVDSPEQQRKALTDLYISRLVPERAKAILDSTSGTTGNVLIRQDLEPILHL